MGNRAKTPDRIAARRLARAERVAEEDARRARTPHDRTREHRDGTALPSGGRSEWCKTCGKRARGDS